MLLKNDDRLVNIAREYFRYGVSLGYFDREQVNSFYQQLLNLETIHDNSLPGDAKIEGNTLLINDKRTFFNERNADLILFHEFTHYCSNIHRDVHNPNGYFNKIRNNIDLFMDTKSVYRSMITKRGDIMNPYTYILYGGLLLDEVTAEYVATKMVSKKFADKMPLFRKDEKIGNYYLDYVSNFQYYGIGQQLVEGFSKTLFVKNEDKNLNGLCKHIANKNFVRDLIIQHNERPSDMKALCEELGYMGVVAWYEEKKQGRLHGKPIPEDFIYHSYQKARQIIRDGYEPRETRPGNISEPSFF